MSKVSGGSSFEVGEGGEDAAAVEVGAVERGVVGGGVDEGLEDGAGGPLGDGVVELGDAVVAAADESEDLAGVGIEGDERDLRIGDGVGASLLVQLADQFVDVLHADLDGFGGGALEFGVERGVDAEALVGEAPGRRCAGRAGRGRDRRSRGLRWRRRWAGRGGGARPWRGSASAAVMAPVSTMESRTRLRRSMARSGWR